MKCCEFLIQKTSSEIDEVKQKRMKKIIYPFFLISFSDTPERCQRERLLL